jgi:N-acetylglucosaminyldiphosphoundecaprenol N-acetyl-beta-D-mannosaminyltransferase
LPPPYSQLSVNDAEMEIKLINAFQANVLFVGLGCPKQEKWMAARRGQINALMIGVGAAFDYHSGNTKRAPMWMQRKGLEWFYRLCTEPRRLFKRYLVTNTLFIVGFTRQMLARAMAGN